MLTAKMTWAGGLKFEGMSVFGHKIATDAAKDAGGNEDGCKPTELLLYGIAGCTGIDIVRILEKQKQPLKALEIQLTAHQNDTYPRPFHTIEVKYIATGPGLDEKKLAEAIELSGSKYCVVGQTIRQKTRVVTSYEIRP